MTDWNRVRQIIHACTVALRKGPMVVELDMGDNIQVVEIFTAPPANDPANAHLKQVDVHFAMIGVDMDVAARLRDRLTAELATYDGLKSGPSYITVGADIGDQEMALRLFGLGEALGLWTVITPAGLGLKGPAADQAAGSGYVMVSGFKPQQEDAK